MSDIINDRKPIVRSMAPKKRAYENFTSTPPMLVDTILGLITNALAEGLRGARAQCRDINVLDGHIDTLC